MKAKDIDIDAKGKMYGLYGPAGTGKTHLAGTFPSPYFADFDDGIITLAGKEAEYDTFLNSFNASTGKITTHACRKFFNWARKNEKDILAGKHTLHNVDEEEFTCHTIVLDSFSAFQSSVCKGVAYDNGHEVPTLPDYNMIVDQLRMFVKRIRTWCTYFNVVCTFHEQLFKREFDGAVWQLPLIVGTKVPFEIPGHFDEFWRMAPKRSQSSVEYGYVIRPGPRDTAKTRMIGLENWECLTYPEVMKKWKSARKKGAK